MAELPDDVQVEPRVVNGEPEVFLSIEGTTFHLRPDDAWAIGTALLEKAHDAEADHAAIETPREAGR